MWGSLVITVAVFSLVYGERAGITHCTNEPYPATLPAGTTTDTGTTGTAYLVDHADYMFLCCGVVSEWKVTSGSVGDVTFQIWRQIAANSYSLVSSSLIHTAVAGTDTYAIADDARMSFREGDLIGWSNTGGDVVGYDDPGTAAIRPVSRYSTAVGNTHDWSTKAAHFGRLYAIQAVTSPSTPPYFKNLPQYKEFTDVEMVTAGVTIMTSLTANDLDPEDAGGLTVTMDPAWTDFFDLSASNVVSTARVLSPGTYEPVFRVEEDHCGQTASATLTVSVTDSVPSITNLPAYVDIHEDTLDETLLYTLATSDPVDQSIWCKGVWTIGAADTPFIVKMISTAAGSSEAGVYVIEWPELDYRAAKVYTLSILCRDTAENTATGTLYVNVIQNQEPVFTNLPFVVVVDATAVVPGTIIYTVSTSDAENDQMTYDAACTTACPFDLYNSGDVVVRESLLLSNTGDYTMNVTAVSLRHTTTDDEAPQLDLTIHVINRNSAPSLTNVADPIPVPENSAAGTPILQVSATDADTADTLTYYYTVAQPEGYGLFAISSTGLLTTHATNVINFENLGTALFTLSIYVHDGKEVTNATMTLNVTDVNEAPVFSQSAYSITHAEDVNGTELPSSQFTVIDPDSGDTHAYTLDCGTYDAYFSMNSSSGFVTFAQDYDLDPGVLPTSHTCTVTVTDTDSNTATASLYITIEYGNNHSPVFSSTAYDVTLATDTVLGTSIFKVTVTDADAGADGTISLTLDQTNLAGYLFIANDGTIYTSASLTSFTDGDTRTVTVTATDGGTPANGVSVTVTIVFSEVVVTTTTTTDRNIPFIEDSRSVYWLTATSLAGLGCLLIIVFIIYRYCRARKEPLFSWELNLGSLAYAPKRHQKKERVIGRRPKPMERERAPAIRQLRAPPFLPSRLNLYPKKGRVSDVTTEMPRPPSTRALLPGRETAELGAELDRKGSVSPDPFALIDAHPPPVLAVAPAHSFSTPRGAELEYIQGPRSVASQKTLGHGDDITPVPTPEPSEMDAEGLYTTKGKLRSKSNRVSVSPSPIWWDNTTTKHIAGTSMRLDEERKEEKQRRPPSVDVRHVSPAPESPTNGLPKSPVTKPPTPGSISKPPTPLQIPTSATKTPTPDPVKTPPVKIPTPTPTPAAKTPTPKPMQTREKSPTESQVVKTPTEKAIQSPVAKSPTSAETLTVKSPTSIQSPTLKSIQTPIPVQADIVKSPTETGKQKYLPKTPTPNNTPGPTLPGEPLIPIHSPVIKTPAPIQPSVMKTPKPIQSPEKITTPPQSPIAKTPTTVSVHIPVEKTLTSTKSPIMKSPTPIQSPITKTPTQTADAKSPTSAKPTPIHSPVTKTPKQTPIQTPLLKSPIPLESPIAKTPMPIQSPVAKTPKATPIHTPVRSPLTKTPKSTPTETPDETATIKTPTPIQSPVAKTPTPIQSPFAKSTTPVRSTYISSKTPESETSISIQSPDTASSTPKPVETPTLYNTESPVAKTPKSKYVPVHIPIEKTTGHERQTPKYVPIQIPIENATTTTMQPAADTPDKIDADNVKDETIDKKTEDPENLVRVTPSPIWWDNTTTSYITGTAEEVD